MSGRAVIMGITELALKKPKQSSENAKTNLPKSPTAINRGFDILFKAK